MGSFPGAEQMLGPDSTQLRLATAGRVARAIGHYLHEELRSSRTPELTYKGEINIVTVCDKEAQRRIVKGLRTDYPGDTIYAEEGHQDGALNMHASGWIVDPLDGTTNFAHKLPHFCVSIAYHVEGEVRLGVVYAPVLDELYWASLGGGAFLNGLPIHVTQTRRLREAVIASGFPYDLRVPDRDNLKEWGALIRRVRAMRCAGAAALDLCYTACGRYDAFWELDLEPWDTAAGGLILAEAGGKVTTVRGESHTLLDRSLVASNTELHSDLLAALGGVEDGKINSR